MSEAGTLERLLLAVGEGFAQLANALTPDGFAQYVYELGLRLPPGFVGDLAASLNSAALATGRLEPVVAGLRSLIDDEGSSAATLVAAGGEVAAEIVGTAKALDDLAQAMAQKATALADPEQKAQVLAFASQLAMLTLERALLERLDAVDPRAARLLAVTGLVDDHMEWDVGGSPDRHAYYVRRIYVREVSRLLSEPSDYLEEQFGWGRADFDATELLKRLKWWSELGAMRARWTGMLDPGVPDPLALQIGWFRLDTDKTSSPPGLQAVIQVPLASDIDSATELAGGWTAYVQSKSRVDAGLVASLSPTGEGSVEPIGAPTISARAGLRFSSASGEPATLLGLAGGSRLEASEADLFLDLQGLSLTPRLGVEASGLSFVLDLDGGDSFLNSISDGGSGKSDISLGATWSPATGVQFSGSAVPEVAIPVNVGIGPATLETVYLIGKLGPDALSLEISGAVRGELGPLKAVVDRVGLLATVTFPPDGANLGIANLDIAFSPPKGVGIAIDAALVTGGGFLEHTGHEYAGALDLSLCGYAVKAFGLIQTPGGGQPGYSFIAVISVQFVPAIDLPYDFTLEGVGGFVGVNRTISVNAVEQALWAHHLDTLLFPADPVAAAPQLISALGSYFPAAEGRYVFGPLAKVGWAADIVTGEAALLLELPEPIKLLLIGDVQVGVPSNDPQLVLHISFDGGVDVGKQLAFFDATLHDSRLESYPISGDLAFRYSWGDQAVFALALGGFNPQFQPPAGFPTLKRLAISIHSSVARIEAQSYLALTSNTLQFGARVELTAGTGTFNVHGWLGFDALCERNPLAFEFDLTAGVDLRAGTDVIASVHLDGKLSGPTPWHIAGKASLSLLFFDVTVHFDKTWGSTATALPAPDPVAALAAALADRASWTAVLPLTARAAITPVGSTSDAGDAVLFDPAGTLRITQRVVPLDQPISRFAGTPLAQTTTLTLDSLTAFGNATAPSGTTSAEFAPAQFLELTDAEKLSLPSFSAFDAGVELGGDAVDLGASSRTRAVITPISYVTTTLDSRTDPLPAGSYRPSVSAVLALNTNTDGTQPGVGRYKPPVGTPPRVTLANDQWTIASTTDLSVRTDIPCDGSKLNAHLALGQYLAAHPEETGNVQVVLTQEAS